MENSAYYHFHKILSSEEYSLGRKVSDFLKNFETVKESNDARGQMMLIVATISDVSRDLKSSY